MSIKFFGRRVKVLVQRVGNPLPFSIVGGLGDVTGVAPMSDGTVLASVFDRLHIEFKIEKDNLGHPNTLDLTIYNLAAKTRTQLQDAGGFIQLLAGYADDWPNLPIIFQGNIRTMDHARSRADWITKIQVGDGETAYIYSNAQQTFSAGATAVQIATYLANQIQQADPTHIQINGFLASLPNVAFPLPTFAWGFSVQGNAFEELQRLVGGLYEVSIQDGALQVLALQQGTQNVVNIDAQHGMIESPIHGTPSTNGLPSLLNVKCLLNARIKPGDIISVNSLNTSGNFRVQKLTHTGNLATNDWYTNLECLPIQTALSAPV